MEDVYTLELLTQFPSVKQAISTKAHGSMKKDDGSINFANLLKFAKSQKFPKMPIAMNQVHGTTVALIENDRELVLPATDGLVTNKKGLPLAIVTADCLPIMFYDQEKEVIAVAHAGRKGLVRGIIPQTLAVMESAYGTDPKDVVVGIGPSIEKKCYAVDQAIAKEVEKTFPDFENLVEEVNGEYQLDLRSLSLQILQKEGILDKHIGISEVCTKCDERFYSYRQGDTNGRFVSVISLV